MKAKRIGTGAAMATGVLAATALAFAPSAAAVTPLTATINANCGIFGGGAATLTATQSGTSATITVTSSIKAPIALAKDSIASTFTFVKASGGTTVFSGTKNPAMATGAAVTVGPLSGTVASGDSLQAYGGSLKMTIFGVLVTCTPTAAQSPGPFVFS
ncbi:hypothetical protein [Streptomyces sp. NPDC005423]|uniref:hypothetical protein n=1 Tax=Streptomyces sp. NPDC005423 TaxID=3155343 RepID=UPI0033B389A5